MRYDGKVFRASRHGSVNFAVPFLQPVAMLLLLASGILCAAAFLVLRYVHDSEKRSRNYFPSPPAEPILGHLRAFPHHSPWATFADWSKIYGRYSQNITTTDNIERLLAGEIIHLSVAGKAIIILNKGEDAHNLLESRGSNYSDRIQLRGELWVCNSIQVCALTELTMTRAGMEHFPVLLRYGDDFRTTRRNISQYFNSRAYVHLYPLFANQIKILLKNLLECPENFESHLDRQVLLSVCASRRHYSPCEKVLFGYYC